MEIYTAYHIYHTQYRPIFLGITKKICMSHAHIQNNVFNLFFNSVTLCNQNLYKFHPTYVRTINSLYAVSCVCVHHFCDIRTFYLYSNNFVSFINCVAKKRVRKKIVIFFPLHIAFQFQYTRKMKYSIQTVHPFYCS